MRIQHNILAMNAYRNYNNNTSALSKNLEKLSSGYKINRAGDDAAGLAISEKMRAQISGLNAASKNVKDGISLVKTGEGAMQEIQDMLNRMVTLATQSANGTYDNETDRKALQDEINQLNAEIDRIADSANFNGIKLLDGSLKAESTTAAAVGKLDASDMLDGTEPSKAGAAKVTVNLGAGQEAKAPSTEKNIDALEDDTKTFDGTNPANGTSASVSFKVAGTGTTLGTGTTAAITVGTTKVSDLANAKISATGPKISDVYDISVKTSATKSTASFNVADMGGTTKTNVGGVELATGKTLADVAGADALKNYDVKVTTAGSFTATVDFTASAETKIGTNTLSTATKVDDLAAMATDYIITVADSSGNAKTGTATLAATDVITFTEKKASGKSAADLATAANALVTNGGTISATSQLTAGVDKTVAADGAYAIQTGDKITLTAKTPGADTALSGDTIIKNAEDKTATDGVAAGTVNGWDSDYKILAGDEITLTAKTPGADTNLGTLKTSLVTGQDGTVTEVAGTNQGAAPDGADASYKFTLDTTKLQGGQKIKFGSEEITINTDSTGSTTKNIAYIGGKDAKGQVVEILKAIQLGSSDAWGTGYTGTDNATFKVKDNGDGTFEVTMNAVANSKEKGNLGTFHVTTADGNNPITVTEYNRYVDPATAPVDKIAQVTYKDEALQAANLKDGSELKIGDTVIKVVAAQTDVKNANEIGLDTLKGAGGDAKLAELIEKQATFTFGKATYNGTTGELTIVTDQSGAGKLDALKEATKVSVSTPGTVQTPATPGDKVTSEGKIDIVFGETTYEQLANQTVTLSTKETVKLGDVFNISGTGTIKAGDTITFEAKQKGKLDEELMKAVNFDPKSTTNTGNAGKVTTEIQEGWDEGETGAGQNTHYELEIDTEKLAGGNAFTFGNVNGKSYTFDITYDSVDTKNGSATADKEDVSGNSERVQINLATAMSPEQKMDAIKKIVETKMGGDFNVKIKDGSTLVLDAKQGGNEYNLGNVRVSSESGALKGTYSPYNASSNGTEGTYAQVSYDFDVSKMKAGDSLTIGGVTVNVGEKAVAAKDKSITITEAEAQDSKKLVEAFESAGFQSGQIKIDGGKMTITGIKTGETGADLAKNLGVSMATTRKDAVTGGLTLQIGDTSESFNQLQVNIENMHAEALGVGDINIGTQDGAKAAINQIKAAINKVSSVRGTLGATQNRLEHTSNNLSVMAENIQDAESSIRDTDIAEEMMAYTKNNILVQSAQAMLAQANQVPQGVLQLLG